MSRRLESWMFIAITLVAAVWRYGATIADRDLWGHIRFGQDKIAAGGYIAEDSYSYLTSGQTWFNHEWLGEVAMAGLYDGGGVAALVVVKAALAVGLTGLMVWWLVKAGLEPIRATLLGLVAIIVLTPTFGTFRPQMFTVALFVGLLFIMIGFDRGKRRLLWALPPLFALWVNVHGGVLAGLAVVVVWAALQGLVRKRYGPLGFSLTAVIAMGVHPLGYEHLWFLIRTTTVPRPEIQDWQPVTLVSVVGLAFGFLLVTLAVSIWLSRHELDISTVVPLIALSAAPLVSSRHLQLFVPALFVLGAPYLAKALGRDSPDVQTTSVAGTVAFSMVLVVATTVTGTTMVDAVDCIEVDSSQFEFPARAVHTLSGMEGASIVSFNWGEYLIWHTGPDMQVSIDGRRETVYPGEVVAANLDFINGTSSWERLLDMGPPEMAIVPTASPVATLLADHPGWRIAYEDPVATVLARIPTRSLRIDDELPIDGDGLCFPA